MEEASSEFFLAQSNCLSYRTRKSKAHITACTVEDIISPFKCSAYRGTALTAFDGSVEYLALFPTSMNNVAEKKEEMVLRCITCDDAQ